MLCVCDLCKASAALLDSLHCTNTPYQLGFFDLSDLLFVMFFTSQVTFAFLSSTYLFLEFCPAATSQGSCFDRLYSILTCRITYSNTYIWSMSLSFLSWVCYLTVISDLLISAWYFFLSSLVSGLWLVLCSITLILPFTAIRLTWFHHTNLTYLAVTTTNFVPLSLQFLRFSINFLQMLVSSWMTSLNVSSSQSLAVTNLTWSSINLA